MTLLNWNPPITANVVDMSQQVGHGLPKIHTHPYSIRQWNRIVSPSSSEHFKDSMVGGVLMHDNHILGKLIQIRNKSEAIIDSNMFEDGAVSLYYLDEDVWYV